MSRREQREQIFKILFGVEFHSAEELDEQIALYMEELGEIRQKEADYILNKVHSIVEHLDDLDSSLNAASKNWKTTRMAKAELSILRLAPTRLNMKKIFRCLFPLMKQLNWQKHMVLIRDRHL